MADTHESDVLADLAAITGKQVDESRDEMSAGEQADIATKAADEAIEDILADIARIGEMALKDQDQSLAQQAQGVKEKLHQLTQQVTEAQATLAERSERLQTPYVISEKLKLILQVARSLGKPLLLEGEPGTGKTALAYALSAEENVPLIHCRGKSTLTAESVLYQVDHVSRLNDVMQSANIPDSLQQDVVKWRDYLARGGSPETSAFQSFMTGLSHAARLHNLDRVADIRNYIQYGELGDAIRRAAQGEVVILLFDEIDKAKREFANDLLDELEHLTMTVRETGEEISALKENIIVIITSNHERELPEPFLRRCAYDYIEFPPPEQMTAIVRAHLPDIDEQLLHQVIDVFYKIRGIEGLEKRPSTSEMLDWIKALKQTGSNPPMLEAVQFMELLLKTRNDQETFRRRIKEVELGTEVDREYDMFEPAREVLRGKTVLSLNPRLLDEYFSPADDVYVNLANQMIPFIQYSYDGRNTTYFTINEPGVRRVGPGVFSFDPSNNPYANHDIIIQLLTYGQTNTLRYRIETDGKRDFENIIQTTEEWIIGQDESGNYIYRNQTNGNTVLAEWIVDETAEEAEAN